MKKHLLLLLVASVSFIGLHAQQFYVNEDFNAGTLPTGWTNTALTGTGDWQFGIDAALDNGIDPGNNNIDSTRLAFFDDNTLGASSTNNTAALITPVFNNQGVSLTNLSFDYNYRDFSSTDDSLYVEVYDGTNWIAVWSIAGMNDCGRYNSPSSVPTNCQAAGFPSAFVNIAAYANANCQVRFVYHDGNNASASNYGWYAAIDNVQITAPISNDISVAALSSPTGSSCGLGTNQQPLVKIKNLGSILATGFDVTVDVDNGTQVVTETVNDTLEGQDSLFYQFTTGVDLSSITTYNVTVYVAWSQDGSQVNDTIKDITIVNEVGYNLSYRELFENSAGDWTTPGLSNSTWERGFPTNTFISFAGQGNQAFVTNLDGNYNPRDTGYLVSPCLDFSTQVGDPVITFDLIYDIEPIFDSLYMESSVDNGITWQRVTGSALSENWYNFGKAWSGRSAGWLQVENVLTGLGGEGRVKLRFVTKSDQQQQGEGVGVDNISIRFPTPIDLGISDLVYPQSGPAPACGFAEENIELIIENKGATQINSYEVSYEIVGEPVVTETITTPIPPSTLFTYTFNTPVDLSAAGNYVLNVSVNVPGDGNATNDAVNNRTLLSNGPVPITSPYKQSFDNTFSSGSTPGNSNSFVDSEWDRLESPAYTWQVANSAANLTGGTGPASDHTGDNGNFIYAEASPPITSPATPPYTRGEAAILESPCISFVGKSAITLEYWSFRYGTNMSPIYLDVFNGREWIVDVDSNKQTQSSRTDAWKKQTVNLDQFAGKKLKLRFRTIHQGSQSADVAIDDIVIYEPIAQDAEMLSITSPTSNCAISNNSQVSVEVQNFGTDTIQPGDLNVFYLVERDNDTAKFIVKDTVNIAIAPREVISFDFTVGADLSIPGQEYNLRAWTSIAGDSNVGNDSILTYSVTNFTRGPGYKETFESLSFLDGNCLNPFNDLIGRGWTVNNNNFTWNVQDARVCRGPNGATPTPSTGPEGDHTRGNGKFLYTEANVGTGVAELTSPCIDFRASTGASMAYWYHKYGAQIGNLYIDVLANGVEYLGVDTLIGQTQTGLNDPWRVQGVNLGQFAGQLLQVRFRATRGANILGDIAIDDVEFYEPIAQDARVSAVTSPITECSPSNQVTVLVENFGTDTILPNTANVYFSVNGGPALKDTVRQGIGVGRSVVHNFNPPGEFSAFNTTFVIRSWTSLPGDTNRFNDSTYYVIQNLTQGISYRENFESFTDGGCGGGLDILTRGWEAAPSATPTAYHWEVQNAGACGGTPSLTSGPRTDHTRGNGNFFYTASNRPGSVAYLYLPCVDFDGYNSAGMTFYYHMYGASMGTLSVEVYDDTLATWVSVYSISGQQQNTPSDPWKIGAAKFEEFAGRELQIRFKADKGGPNSDMAIDDIAFYLPQPIDARVNKVLSPTQGCEVFDFSVVSMEIENFGTAIIPANTMSVSYQVDDRAPVTEVVTEQLLVDELDTIQFSTTADLSGLGEVYNIKTWTSASNEGNVDNDTLFNYFVANQSKRTNYFEDMERFLDPGCDAPIGQVTINGWNVYSEGGPVGEVPFGWNVQNSICGSHNQFVTPSGGTGPVGDHTSGNGTFMYTEAGGGSALRGSAIFESSCIDLQANINPKLSFWYHMYGANTGNLYIQVLDTGVWSNVDSIKGEQQTSSEDDWRLKVVSLDNEAGKTVQIRFLAKNGPSNTTATGDISIDDIAIYEASSIDVAITDIVNPGDLDACALSTDTIKIALTNTGTSDITTDFPVRYFYFGTEVVDTVRQNITVGTTINFSFTIPIDFTVAPGKQELRVAANLPGDTIGFNNSERKEINNRQPGFPRYFMDFDNLSAGDLQGWRNTPAAGYSWNINCGAAPFVDGMPMMPPCQQPATGPSGDHTGATTIENGDGCYMLINSNLCPTGQVTDALIELPCGPIDFSNSRQNKILLSYWYHMNGGNTGDLYVDVHDGTTWRNRLDVIRGEQQGDDTDRWRRRQVSLNSFAGLSAVKIRFRAEWIGRGGDMAIDDIEILDRATNDARISRILDPETGCDLTAAERFRVEFQNMGTNDIVESILAYQLTFTPYKGDPVVFPIERDTAVGVNGFVAPLAPQTFEFERVDLSAPGKYSFKIWTEIAGDEYSFNDTIIESITNETRPFPNCEDFSDMVFGDEPKAFRDDRLPTGWVGTPAAYAFKPTIAGGGPTVPDAGPNGFAGGNVDLNLYSDNRLRNNVYLLANDGDAGQPGTITRIESPCYDLTNTQAARLEFYYQAPDPNHFMVIKIRQVGGQYENVDTLYGAGNGVGGIFQWTKKTLILTDYVGGFVQVQFEAISAGGYYAIDDFCIVKPPPQQIALERFVAPLPRLCFYSDSEFVRLRFQNVGIDRITNFKVVLAVDKQFQSFPSGNLLRDTFDVDLTSPPFFEPGNKLDLTLDLPEFAVDMSDRGENFFFNAYTILPGDNNEANNIIEDYNVGHPVPIELPYIEDFELLRGEGAAPVYSNGFFVQSAGLGEYYWEVETQLEPFRFGRTGPEVDHTKGTSEGTYMIPVDTNSIFGDITAFTSRCINLIGTINPEIRYWYYMFSASSQMGDLILEVNDDTGWEQIDILQKSDPDQLRSNSEPWKSRTIDLKDYAGKVIRYRFISIAGEGSGARTAPAVDDIAVYDVAAKDLAVVDLAEPIDDSSSCYTADQLVRINLRNNGSAEIDFTRDTAFIRVDVINTRDGSYDSTLIDTVYNNLDYKTGIPLPRDSVTTFTMSETFDMSDRGANYRFVVSASLQGDLINRNDVYDATVLSQRKGGQVYRVIPNDTVCAETQVQLKLRNHYGEIRWQEKVKNRDGVNLWTNGFSFPVDSSYYNVIPDTNTLYRALICPDDSDVDSVLSTTMEVVVIKPPKPIGVYGSRCDSGLIAVKGFAPDFTPPITKIRMHDSLDPVVENIIAERPVPFGFTQFYTESDTFFLESVVETSKVVEGFCVSIERDTVIANVNTVPEFELGVSDTTICQDTTYIFDAGRVEGRQDTYEWSVILPNGTVKKGTDSVVLSNQTLVVDAWRLDLNKRYGYTVTVTTDSNCVLVAKDTVYITIGDSCFTSLNEISFKDNFSIYPNPVSEELFITHEASENFKGSIRLSTIEGQLIEEVLDVGFGKLNHRFDMGNLPKGIYIIKVETERGSFVEKIIRS